MGNLFYSVYFLRRLTLSKTKMPEFFKVDLYSSLLSEIVILVGKEIF
jgi:hypothetical protein